MSDVGSIVPTASSCSLWSCASKEGEVETGGGLKGRICTYSQVGAGLFCLIASIVGIICALTVWESPMLCIAFAPGGAASIYIMIRGWFTQEQESFSHNNDRFDGSLITLQEENKTLKGTQQQLTDSLADMQQTAAKYQTENTTLKATAEKFDATQKQLEKYTAENSALQVKAASHAAHIEVLSKSLASVEQSISTDQKSIGLQLQLLSTNVAELAKLPTQFNSSGTQLETTMKQGVEALVAAGQSIVKALTEQSKWLDEKATKERAELLAEQNRQLGELKEQTGKYSGQLEESKRQLEEMERIRKGLVELHDRIQASADSLSKTDESFKTTLETVGRQIKKIEGTPTTTPVKSVSVK